MKNLFKALAAFQQAVPVIHKATQGYGYTYADLPAIFETINPLLKEHGLGFTQLIEGTSIKTIVFHSESGETLESVTEIPQDVKLNGMNQFQVLGSAITYIRRYALSAALGLVTDKDTDAAGQQKPEIKQPAAAPKQNIATLPPNELNRISAALANLKDLEGYEALKKKEMPLIKQHPSLKGMFSSKLINLQKLQLNGNA